MVDLSHSTTIDCARIAIVSTTYAAIYQGASPRDWNTLDVGERARVILCAPLRDGENWPEDERFRYYPFADDIYGPSERERGIIEAAVADAFAALADHRDVFVFCREGRNRSGLVVGLTLRRLGWTGQAAIDLIRSKRAKALTNTFFADMLLAPKAG